MRVHNALGLLHEPGPRLCCHSTESLLGANGAPHLDAGGAGHQHHARPQPRVGLGSLGAVRSEKVKVSRSRTQ